MVIIRRTSSIRYSVSDCSTSVEMGETENCRWFTVMVATAGCRPGSQTPIPVASVCGCVLNFKIPRVWRLHCQSLDCRNPGVKRVRLRKNHNPSREEMSADLLVTLNKNQQGQMQ